MEPGVIAPAMLSSDPATGASASQVDAGYGTNLSDASTQFANSLERADAAAFNPEPSPIAKALFEPLEQINNEARNLAEFAQSAIESGNELTPSEIVQLTTRSQEFMFYSQLTSNVANRTADGLQQLFRQQS